MAVDVGSAVGYLDLDINGFLKNLKAAQDEADKSTQNMAQKVGANISGIGKNISSAGSTLTKTVTLPLVGIAGAGLKVATDFEKGMSEVRAISGATGKDFDALREKAIELGADTAFSSNEVAAAMTEMAKAGWNADLIVKEMGGVLSAAAASGEGLASVATIVADAMTGFADETLTSTKVADLLTQAANSGTIGIADLGESFKYIAPVAGAMGLSIEDTTTAISAMSMAGIKGSQAGTALRTMLTNLVNPSDSAATVMEELGISATNADGSMKSLDEIVANLRDGFSGLTEAEKAQSAAILAGKTGMSGMLALLNLTEEEYNAIAESMDNAGGVAEETAAIMQDNLQSKIEQLGGALESLAIKMADYVLPYLQQFVVWLTGLIDKFTNLDESTQKTILVIAGIAAAIGPVLLIVGKLTTGVGNMITTFGKIPGMVTSVQSGFTTLKTGFTNMHEGFTLARSGFGGLATEAGGFGTKMGVAMAGITGPMLAIAAVIAVVIAAFVSLWKNNEEFRNKVIGIWNQIKGTFSEFTQGIVERLNALGFDFTSFTDVVKTIWEGFCNYLAPIFEGVFQQVANIFEFVTNSILNAFDFWIAIFKGDWEGAWGAVKSQFENIWNLIKSTLENVLNTMKGIFDVVLGWFGTSWNECWNGISTAASNIWGGITTTLSTAWNNIKSTASIVWNGIMNAIKIPINKARDFVKDAIDKIKGFFNFKITWPHIPMPHFKISPPGWKVGDLLKGKIPKLSIDWYAKAMRNPMLLTKPTIFGYNPATGQLMGGGEAGPEVVSGASALMRMISQAVMNSIKPMTMAAYQLANATAELGYVTYNGFVKVKERFEERDGYEQNDSSNGDVYNFYSPKPIDEIEAARQMKKAKRDLAEGF